MVGDHQIAGFGPVAIEQLRHLAHADVIEIRGGLVQHDERAA